MDYRRAVTHLKRVDRKLADVITAVGPCRFVTRAEGSHFEAVARAIVYQQLSGKAAGTINRRFHGLYGDRAPDPGELLATPDEDLRAVGLSRQKIGYLRDLATRRSSASRPSATRRRSPRSPA
jgi:DNA-3-methyladenine glycosylase II